jgi:hypothetical protein
MAREGISDVERGWKQLGAFLDHLVGASPERFGQSYSDFVLEKVRIKQRQYNTGLNEREPGADDEDPEATAYRKASRGS